MRSLPPRRARSVSALLLSAVAASAALTAGEVRAQDPVASLPAGAHAVVATEDLAGFWQRLSTTRLYAAITALPSVHKDIGDFEARREAWMRVLGQRAAIGFYGQRGAHDPDVIAVAQVGDAAAARLAMTALETRIVSDRGGAFAVQRHGAASVRVAHDSAGAEVFAWALAGNRLLAASGAERLGQALDLAGSASDGSMAGDPRWREAADRVRPGAITVWADLASLRPPGSPATAAARSLALSAGWVDNGLRADARVELDPAAPPEFTRLLGGATGPLRALDKAPAATLILFAATSLDLNAYGDALRAAMAGRAGADSAAARWDGAVARFEASTGIDVERELVPALGREVALAVTGVDRGFLFPVPRFAFLLQARDETALRGVMGKLETWSSRELRERRSLPITWQGETYQGVSIRYAPTPLGDNVEPSYALHDGTLIVGSGRDAVREILDADAGRAPALGGTPEFGAMAAFFPDQASGASYLDLAGIAARVRELAGSYGWIDVSPGSGAATILDVVENVPHLGVWSEPDGEGAVAWHALLEIR